MSNTNFTRLRTAIAVSASLASVALMAGCAEDASSSGGGSGGSVKAEAGVEQAEARLAVLEKGTSVLPDDTPRPAATGKRIAIVVTGMANSGAAEGVAGDLEACDVIGWTCDVLDGQTNPTLYSGLVRQAIAAKVDAIIVHGIDCAGIRQAVKDANAADIPVVGQLSNTCGADEPLFAGSILYPDANDPEKLVGYQEHNEQYGHDRGTAIVANTDGKPNLINIYNTELALLKDINKGTTDAVKELEGAQVDDVEMRLADLGPKLEGLTTSALLKNPKANALSGPFGASYATGIVSAIQKANRGEGLFVMGVEGDASELDLMREGDVSAAMYAENAWAGWAGIDSLNSVFTGVPIVNSGIGWTYITKDDLTDEAGSKPNIDFPDFRSAYATAWGK